MHHSVHKRMQVSYQHFIFDFLPTRVIYYTVIIGYASQYSQSGQRLSPHHQQHISQQQQQVNAQQQQQMAFQAAQAANANVTPQLSPRQPPFGGGAGGVQSPTGLPSSQQWNAGGNVSTPSVQLSGNVTTQRAHSLQQHNPMLSAQLQVSE